MKICNEAVEIIMYFEGFRSSVYYCPGGYKTIGYGHKLLANEAYDNISRTKALEILYQDIENLVHIICCKIEAKLNANQFGAIISFAFNVGAGAFISSTLRKKINNYEFESVSDEFLKWIFIKGKVTQGLLLRRQQEAALFNK